METNSLPKKLPYSEIMVFHYAKIVEVVMKEKTLQQCEGYVQVMFDNWSEDVTRHRDGVLVFIYHPRAWLKICNLLRKFDANPPKHCGASDCVPPDDTYCIWLNGCTIDWDAVMRAKK